MFNVTLIIFSSFLFVLFFFKFFIDIIFNYKYVNPLKSKFCVKAWKYPLQWKLSAISWNMNNNIHCNQNSWSYRGTSIVIKMVCHNMTIFIVIKIFGHIVKPSTVIKMVRHNMISVAMQIVKIYIVIRLQAIIKQIYIWKILNNSNS